MDPVTGGLISAGIEGGFGLLTGLLSRRSAKKAYARQRADALEDRLNTGVHAVQAAERSGFNPLTMLGAMGGTNLGVQMGDTGPPLASVQLMSNAISKGMDEITGVASQRRARDELELDLAKIKLDQARVAGEQARVRASLSSHAAPGGSSAPASQSWVDPNLGLSESWAAPGRKVDVEDQKNRSGYTTIENWFTGGPVDVWGDEVEGDALSMATAAVQMAPQMVHNWIGRPFGNAVGPYLDRAAASFSDHARGSGAPSKYSGSKPRSKATSGPYSFGEPRPRGKPFGRP